MSDFLHGKSRRERMLVSGEWLEKHRGDDDLRIIDCSAQLIFQPVGPSRVESGLAAYRAQHIPGARYLNMATDLSDPSGAYAFTMPGDDQIESVLGGLGISKHHSIVLYGSGYVGSVTRIWYVLRAAGHTNIALLDGGFERWLAEGRPVTSETVACTPTRYQVSRQVDLRSEVTDVQAAIEDPATALINALSRDQFLGRAGTHYGRPGRIPSSHCAPAREMFEADGRSFRPDGELRQMLSDAGLRPDQRIISYCGGGIAATVTAFVLEMLGHDRWSVYDDSLNEWATRSELPMVTGEGS